MGFKWDDGETELFSSFFSISINTTKITVPAEQFHVTCTPFLPFASCTHLTILPTLLVAFCPSDLSSSTSQTASGSLVKQGQASNVLQLTSMWWGEEEEKIIKKNKIK